MKAGYVTPVNGGFKVIVKIYSKTIIESYCQTRELAERMLEKCLEK